MRNNKALKILFLVLALALLIGSAIGIAASAEGDYTYEIKSINIAHGDRIQVLIAVDAPIEDAANIEVKYTLDGVEKIATYWKNIDIYGDGVEYPVYYTAGISAKDIGESVTAEAHKSGATDYTPLSREVSVIEYLFTKLYKEGYIIATEGADANRKTLYLELIDYGAAAQQSLYNDLPENADDQRVLLTDRYYVFVNEGTIDGEDHVILNGGGTVELTYTGTEGANAWKVTSWVHGVGTSTVVYTDTVEIFAPTTITPYVDPYLTTFEKSEVGGITAVGKEETMSGGLFTESTIVGSTDNFPETITINSPSSTNVADGNIPSPGNMALIKLDQYTGNKYFYLAAGNKNLVQSSKGRPLGWSLTALDETDDANVSILEFDILVETGASGYIGQLGFYSANDKLGIYPHVHANSKTNTVGIYDKNDLTNPVASFATGKLVNIRFEYYFDEGVCQLYINNIYSGNLDDLYSKDSVHAKLEKFNWGTDSSSVFAAQFDNILIKNTTKNYRENPTNRPTVETFEGAYSANVVTWNCTNGTYKSEVESGKFADKTFEAVDLLFKNGVNITYSSGSSYSYQHSAEAKIVTDSLTRNKYVHIFVSKRISDRDRGYGVTFTPQVLDKTHDVYVLETDMKLDSVLPDGTASHKNYITMAIHTSEAKTGTGDIYAQFNMTADNYNSVKLDGVKIGNWDEWFSVRFELYLNPDPTTESESAVVQVYTKNADGEWEYVHTFTTAASGKLENIQDVTSWGFGGSNNSSSGYSISYDNSVLYSTSKTYVENPAE